jgi:hypothetical protein
MDLKDNMSEAVTSCRTKDTYFDGVDLQTKSIVGGQEFLYIFALITLKLNHLAHLSIVDNGAIASCSELLVADRPRLNVEAYRISS